MKTSNPTADSLPGQSEVDAGDFASIPETSDAASPSRAARMKRIFHRSNQGPSTTVIATDVADTWTSGGGQEQQQHSQATPDQGAGETSGGAPGQREKPQAAPIKDAEESIDTLDLQASSDRRFTSFKLFKPFVSTLTNVHPYTQVALGILISSAQQLLTTASVDEAVLDLFDITRSVYEFLMEQDRINGLDKSIIAKLARTLYESAEFIRNYSEVKNFWERLRKDTFSETRAVVDHYKKTIDILMQRCRDDETRDIRVNLRRLMDDRKLEGMACAGGGGLNMMKGCLDGTRTEILKEIITWFHDRAVAAPRILWLRGQAGSGKSVIAHTVASWMKDMGGLGSYFSFSRDQQAENSEMFLRTVARGLADHDQSFRRALADAVSEDPSLKTTSDVIQQWQKLILKPLSQVNGIIIGNVVVVVDALDESGPDTSREHILSLLTSPNAAGLPSNFRILLTSRPLPDIERALSTTAHVRTISLDSISEEHDIGLHVKLCCHPEIGATEIQSIGQKSDRLFE